LVDPMTEVARPIAFKARGILALATMILVACAISPGVAAAAQHAGRPTVLRVAVTETVALGTHPVVTVHLTAGGKPVKGKQVGIRLDGKISQQVKTGADGRATTEIVRDLSAGRYEVSARFAGTSAYRSSTSRTEVFTVTPVQLTISTVPPTPGIPLLSVDGGAPLVTGADGTVVATMTQVGRVALQLALPPDDATQQVRLARWDNGSTDPVRTIRIPDTLSASVGLQLLHPIQFDFTSSDGTPIADTDVPTVSVSDDAGHQQVFTGTGSHWLPSNAINRLTSGLASSPVEYRVAEVPLGGQNAVNRGQQRFTASSPQIVKIGLLAFNLVVQGRDALLKSPIGTQVIITDPTGGQRVLDLDANSTGMTLLPRGEYSLAIHGGDGIAIKTPVALSREQHADVLFVSPLDIALVVGIAAAPRTRPMVPDHHSPSGPNPTWHAIGAGGLASRKGRGSGRDTEDRSDGQRTGPSRLAWAPRSRVRWRGCRAP
jgi:hypothetical protein